jgi:hypothetical protein
MPITVDFQCIPLSFEITYTSLKVAQTESYVTGGYNKPLPSKFNVYEYQFITAQPDEYHQNSIAPLVLNLGIRLTFILLMWSTG